MHIANALGLFLGLIKIGNICRPTLALPEIGDILPADVDGGASAAHRSVCAECASGVLWDEVPITHRFLLVPRRTAGVLRELLPLGLRVLRYLHSP